MPTGWRPEDVLLKYPVEYTKDAFTQIKYAPELSKELQVWSWAQYLIKTLLVLHFLLNIANVSTLQLFLYAGFIFTLIYSFTALMDKDPLAFWMELGKSIFGIGLIWYFGDWFLIEQVLPFGNMLLLIYLVISPIIVGYFVQTEIIRKNLNVDLIETS